LFNWPVFLEITPGKCPTDFSDENIGVVGARFVVEDFFADWMPFLSPMHSVKAVKDNFDD